MRILTREDLVAEFHMSMSQALGEPFTSGYVDLRQKLIYEETEELGNE